MRTRPMYVPDRLSRNAEVFCVEGHSQHIEIEASPEFKEIVRRLAAELGATETEVVATALNFLKRFQDAEAKGLHVALVDGYDEIVLALDCK